jgi:hypothetical protein
MLLGVINVTKQLITRPSSTQRSDNQKVVMTERMSGHQYQNKEREREPVTKIIQERRGK